MSLYLDTAGIQKPYSKGPPTIMKMKNKKQVWQVNEDSPKELKKTNIRYNKITDSILEGHQL